VRPSCCALHDGLSRRASNDRVGIPRRRRCEPSSKIRTCRRGTPSLARAPARLRRTRARRSSGCDSRSVRGNTPDERRRTRDPRVAAARSRSVHGNALRLRASTHVPPRRPRAPPTIRQVRRRCRQSEYRSVQRPIRFPRRRALRRCRRLLRRVRRPRSGCRHALKARHLSRARFDRRSNRGRGCLCRSWFCSPRVFRDCNRGKNETVRNHMNS
jgi:hypothetical protein